MNDEKMEPGLKLTGWAMDNLLPFIKACPRVVKNKLGLSNFIDELNEATKIVAYNPEIMKPAQKLLPFIEANPQIIQNRIGVVSYTNELIRAAKKYLSFTEEKNTRTD